MLLFCSHVQLHFTRDTPVFFPFGGRFSVMRNQVVLSFSLFYFVGFLPVGLHHFRAIASWRFVVSCERSRFASFDSSSVGVRYSLCCYSLAF